MMIKRIQYTLLALWLVLVPSLLFAATPSPIELLQSASEQMIAALKANKASLQQNPDSVYSIVKRILLPHIDNETMARSVLGRDVWKNASSAQRKQFVDEYTFLIVRTYSRALASYNDQQVRFLPMRDGYEGKRFVQVNSLIIQKDGPSIPVNYRLRLLGDVWKVYDISVENVSMVQSYRAQFADKINQSGLSGLLTSLVELNKNKQ